MQGQVLNQIEIFGRLLNEFSLLVTQTENERGLTVGRMDSFLSDFVAIQRATHQTSLKAAARDVVRYGTLLADYASARKLLQEQQRFTADDFNLLEVLQLTYNEVRHSMVLAWLLDRDISRGGTHAQGSLGFKLFLEELGWPAKYADTSYVVYREVVGDRSRIDIEVMCRGEFVIHVENKIWSSEGEDQTWREWGDLQKKASQIGLVPGSEDVRAIFLTPKGSHPECEYFRAVSWKLIANVLEKFADEAKPQDVKLFASHYARSLRRFIVSDDIMRKSDNEQTAIQ